MIKNIILTMLFAQSFTLFSQCGNIGVYRIDGQPIRQIVRTSTDGNLYVFGNGTYGLPNQGISIFDKDGNLLNSKTISGSAIFCTDFAVDRDKNVYLTGDYELSIDLGNGFSFSGMPGNNLFVAKLDSNLQTVWAWNYVAFSNSTGEGIAVDTFGNVYMVGKSGDGLTLDTVSVPVTQSETYITRINTDSGRVQWIEPVAGSSFSGFIKKVAVDNLGEVYYKLVSPGAHTSIYKLDSLGVQQWSTDITYNNVGRGMDVDDNGNLHIYGHYQDQLACQGDTLYNSFLHSLYRCKLSPSGNLLSLGRIGASHYSSTLGMLETDIDVQPDGSYFISGTSDTTVNFNGYSVSTSHNSDRFFVAKFDSLNTILWAKSFGKANSICYPGGVVKTNACQLIFHGFFYDSLKIDTVTIKPSSSSYSTAGFFVELNPVNGDIFAMETNPFGQTGLGFEENDNITDINVFPNPTSNLLWIESKKELDLTDVSSLMVFNGLGQNVTLKYEHSGKALIIDVTHLPSGIYYGVYNTSTFKFVVKH